MEQVYCKLQNTRYRFKTDDPEIRRVLRDEFRTYQHSLKQRILNASYSDRKEVRTRRMWSREEMDIL